MTSVPHALPESDDKTLRSKERAQCPFCAVDGASESWRGYDQDGEPYAVFTCPQCSTHFLFPPPDANQLSRAYASSYYGEGTTKFPPAIEKLREKFADARARTVIGRLKTGDRVLDVGCGNGAFLQSIDRQGRYELHGVELPGKAAERAALISRLHLHIGVLETVDFPANHFDFISLIHVFEHVPNPARTLEILARILKPGGRLFLSFPNIKSIQARLFRDAWFHLDPPRHLSLVPPDEVIRRLNKLSVKHLSTSHFNLEQNIYGWLQSGLNLTKSRKNLLYEHLKRNTRYTAGVSRSRLFIEYGIAAAGFVPAVIADALAAAVRSGATVEMSFQKN